jgi:uncharacterized membrane protein
MNQRDIDLLLMKQGTCSFSFVKRNIFVSANSRMHLSTSVIILFIFAAIVLTAITIFVMQKHMQTKGQQQNKSNTQAKTIFVDKSYMEIVISDSSYFQRMSKADLLARSISSQQGYIKLYTDSLQSFSAAEKQTLRDLIKQASTYIAPYKNLSSLDWKLIKISSNIEMGWPHTLGDVIILSATFFELPKEKQLTTIIHEQIHVYQRAFPIETNRLIESWDFKILNRMENIPLARNNPDLNSFVYGRGNIEYVQLYNSPTPKDLADSSPSSKEGEHPYEMMAALLPTLITSEKNNSHHNQTPNEKATKEWMIKYL